MSTPLSLKERLQAAAAKAATTPTTPVAPVATVEAEPEAKPMTALEKIKAARAAKAAPAAQPEPLSLTKVITAANLVEQGLVPESKSDSPQPPSMQGLDISYIRQKIAELQTVEDGPQLKGQMDVLRAMLLANPDACALMLPEDLGLMVRAVRKMTSNKVAADLGRTRAATKPAKDKKLTAAEMQAAVEEGDWD